MIKISFLGDIICQMPFLKAASNRSNDFYTAFSGIQPLLADSDYVVANLETPIAGKDAGYSKELYSFNTPSVFLDSLKNLKIDLYLTANNHCLDRGIEGLKSTILELNKRNMAHTGTAIADSNPRFYTIRLGETSIAFLSYAGYINEDKWSRFGKSLSKNNLNILIDIDKYISYRTQRRESLIRFYKLRKALSNFIPHNLELKTKDFLGIKLHPYTDNEPLSYVGGEYLKQVRKDIAKMKETCDLVILLPHCGGQFNTKPGSLSAEIFESLFSFGADAVIGNHAHTIHKCGFNENRPYAFSLGNVSMSPSYSFQVRESLPEYGMIFNLYIKNKKIVKATFSLFKSIEESDHYPIIKTIDKLFEELNGDGKIKLKKDVEIILKRIFEDECTSFDIKKEYELTNPEKGK